MEYFSGVPSKKKGVWQQQLFAVLLLGAKSSIECFEEIAK